MGLQESGEMYLETILILSRKQKLIRAVDVGEYMGFSKPSVSRAVGILKSEGFVTGMAAKMFTVAGPVIVFGTLASAVYGVVLMLT